MPDKRDQKTWVILELTRQGEQKVADGVFEGVIRKAMQLDPSHGVFIPSMTYRKAGRIVTLHLMRRMILKIPMQMVGSKSTASLLFNRSGYGEKMHLH